MNFIVLLASILAAYLWLLFVVIPFSVPFMRTHLIPQRIPSSFEQAIDQFERKGKTPYEYIVFAQEYLLSQNSGERFSVIVKGKLAFETSISKLLKQRGFMHCHHFNYLMRIMLVRSKFFKEQDVRLRLTFLNLFVHQYLQVRISGQWYDIDLWGANYGVPLGKHAWGFR